MPVNTGFVASGIPDGRFLKFYETRSSPKLYCSIVGNVVIPGGYASNAMSPTISRAAVWAELAETIKERGSRPGIQLSTTWPAYLGSKKFVTQEPEKIIADACQLVSDIGRVGIKKVVESFRVGMEIAEEHGFEHIQFHGAHGYLLNLLIDARINPYAQDTLDNLAAFAEKLRGDGVQTSLRISMRSGCLEFDNSGMYDFLDLVARLPFDFIDLSSGFYNIDKRLIYPSRPEILNGRISDSLCAALRHPNRMFIMSGRIFRYNLASLPQNASLGVCRDLIANPNFLNDPRSGCDNHGKCHYYSRSEEFISCAKWT